MSWTERESRWSFFDKPNTLQAWSTACVALFLGHLLSNAHNLLSTCHCLALQQRRRCVCRVGDEWRGRRDARGLSWRGRQRAAPTGMGFPEVPEVPEVPHLLGSHLHGSSSLTAPPPRPTQDLGRGETGAPTQPHVPRTIVSEVRPLAHTLVSCVSHACASCVCWVGVSTLSSLKTISVTVCLPPPPPSRSTQTARTGPTCSLEGHTTLQSHPHSHRPAAYASSELAQPWYCASIDHAVPP